MANTINILKPSVCFEVQRIIGISKNDGNNRTYQVQWAPSWISGTQLVGCEDLIEQFECEQKNEEPGKDVDIGHSEDDTPLVLVQVEVNEVDVDEVDVNKSAEDVNLFLNLSSELEEEGFLVDSKMYINHRNQPYSYDTNNNSDINVKGTDMHSQSKTIGNCEQHVSRTTIHPDFQWLEEKSSSNMYRRTEEEECMVLSFQSDLPITDESNNKDGGHRSDTSENCVEATFIVEQTTDDILSTEVHIKDGELTDVQLTDSGEECKTSGVRELLTHVNRKTNKNTERKPKVNNLSQEMFYCRICKKTLHSNVRLKHLKSHASTKVAHQCSTCDRKFASKVNLQKHELIHSSGKEYACNVCKEIFSDDVKLQLHIQVHRTKENRYKCTFCTKSFFTSTDLKRHIRVHTGERPFQCKVCGKRFQRKYNLQRHSNSTHSQERPSMCDDVFG